MTFKRWFPTAAFGAALLLATAQAAELPVKHVVLFKHGIGYFQRQGRLNAGETAQLDFNANDMNDVLKSLTLQESGQGTITGLRYDSSLPLERKLAEFPFRLGEGQPITAVLDQLKGAQIEMRFASETVRGAIVGARVVPRTEQRPEMQQVSLLLDNGEFRNVDLSAATGMKFIDPKLQTQFADYLGALNQARSRDKRSVYIDSTGGAARDVTASYMIPMPVWKSSYRLIYPTSANAKPTLEGWAIVDNTTGEDWTGVQLSLVSGRPISFISRLYEPRYVGRVSADVDPAMAQAPVVNEGAFEAKAMAAPAAPQVLARLADGGAGVQGRVVDPSGAALVGASITLRNLADGSTRTVTADGNGNYSAFSLSPGTYEVTASVPGFQMTTRRVRISGGIATANFSLDVGNVSEAVMITGEADEFEMSRAELSSVDGLATGGDLGELFEYRFGKAVTVRKNESAMLPFLQQPISGRKLILFKREESEHPFHSMELTNDTGKTLDGGPITVYEGGGYAGEALVETLKEGDKRLISYGVDLGTRITTEFESDSSVVREIHVRRGLLTTKTAISETKTYTIRNVDKEAKTIVIEHPARQGYKLLDKEPSEKTKDAYRFEVKLAADSSQQFPVKEENIVERSTLLTSFSPDVLVSYIQNKNLSATGRTQLQQLLDLKRQIAGVDGEIRRTQEQINTMIQDQSRLRDNINSLNRVPGQEVQVQNYSKQLAAQEVQIASMRDRVSTAQQRKVALEGQLNSLIEKMEF